MFFPRDIRALGSGALEQSAVQEFRRGLLAVFPAVDFEHGADVGLSAHDGKFAANVVLQIKEGPIDFQAREPVSPLFAGLRQTSSPLALANLYALDTH